VTVKGAEALLPFASTAKTVCVPTFTAQGRAKVPDPLPVASVVTVPSVRFLTMMLKVSLKHCPDSVTVMVPPWPTVGGVMATGQGPGP
jgi:hypothetical protein